MSQLFPYDPIKPAKVIKRATIKARKLIVERVVALGFIFLTLFGGFMCLLYGLARVVFWILKCLGY
jgi:hypothetical protein